jgi:hypothetical protein
MRDRKTLQQAIAAARKAVLLVARMYREEDPMAKKLSASSRLGKQISVSAESIRSKPLTKHQKAVLDGVTGGRNAPTFLRSTIPIFRRSPISSSPSSDVRPGIWWLCVLTRTY